MGSCEDWRRLALGAAGSIHIRDFKWRCDWRALCADTFTYCLGFSRTPSSQCWGDDFDRQPNTSEWGVGQVQATCSCQHSVAYATLDVHHPGPMAAIAARMLQKGALDKLNPQAVANTVWAFATLGVHHPKLMAAIAARTLKKGALDKLNPQAVANMVWAFATLVVHHPGPMAAIVVRTLEKGALDKFSPQAVVNTVWSLAVSDAHCDATTAGLLKLADTMNAQERTSALELSQLHHVYFDVASPLW